MGQKWQFRDDTPPLRHGFPVSGEQSCFGKEQRDANLPSRVRQLWQWSDVSCFALVLSCGWRASFWNWRRAKAVWKDSEKCSGLLIPSLLFYCSDAWSVWDLVAAIEEFISLCSRGEKCFSGDILTWLQLRIRVLSCCGSQPAMKRNRGHAPCAAEPWGGRYCCSARAAASHSQEWISKASR